MWCNVTISCAHEEALVNHVSIIAEHLLRKATNLAECALGWQGVAPTSVLLRNVIKGVGLCANIRPT